MFNVVAKNPKLIIEGKGDAEAIPVLLRTITLSNNYSDFFPDPVPILKANLKAIKGKRTIEKYIQHALNSPADSVMIAVDSDDVCPINAVTEIRQKMASIHISKPVAICIFYREFETMFLQSIDSVMQKHPQFGWRNFNIKAVIDEDSEKYRDAKGRLSEFMEHGRRYNAVIDQQRFAKALDYNLACIRSRAFCHLDRAVKWLYSTKKSSLVYP
jgi:hypothetical protein